MHLKLTLLGAFLFLAVTGFAQDPAVIKGKVKDGLSRKDMEGVTITLVRTKDTFLVKATSTDKEGNYSLVNVPKGSYRMLYTFLGYKPIDNAITVVEGWSLNLGTQLLSTEITFLKDVSVVSKKAFIERKIDKTVINVDASILNA